MESRQLIMFEIELHVYSPPKVAHTRAFTIYIHQSPYVNELTRHLELCELKDLRVSRRYWLLPLLYIIPKCV